MILSLACLVSTLCALHAPSTTHNVQLARSASGPVLMLMFGDFVPLNCLSLPLNLAFPLLTFHVFCHRFSVCFSSSLSHLLNGNCDFARKFRRWIEFRLCYELIFSSAIDVRWRRLVRNCLCDSKPPD
ncbi:hypothetical protein EDD18DRAFT_747080 [Armillaria luteobubalina]|uniref:Secreted protein n=1 Tax=Armillaria luteobubalina TaxID=153913 RepID=A0AA39QGM9_9AGAR|nr:hypothetical protein EDD18DRAFT_747080 [Armillaria luteobubalina]